MARDLNDLVAITRTIEYIGDRFQTLDKRLTISQTKAYQRQAIELVRAAHHLFQTIPNYQPTENEAKLYDQARLSLENNQVVLSALRKRLILIFKGPETSSFDSDKAKARKLRLTERCNTIRNMEPEVVLWWVKAYPTSVWEVSQMSDRTFDYLVDKMSSQRVQALHSDHDNLCAFASEGPLDSCEEYRNFTQAFHAAAYRLAQSSTDFGLPLPLDSNNTGTRPVQVGSELLHGRVYNLSIPDLQLVGVSDNVRGGPWLTDPYDVNNFPFVTVQISRELGGIYATQRPQQM